MRKVKTGRRFLSFLLCFVMVVSMLPAVGMTASAADSEVLRGSFGYRANGEVDLNVDFPDRWYSRSDGEQYSITNEDDKGNQTATAKKLKMWLPATEHTVFVMNSAEQVDFTRDFTIWGSFQDNGHGDGMTITFQREANFRNYGCHGGRLGVYPDSNDKSGGARNALVLEFDTFGNESYHDHPYVGEAGKNIQINFIKSDGSITHYNSDVDFKNSLVMDKDLSSYEHAGNVYTSFSITWDYDTKMIYMEVQTPSGTFPKVEANLSDQWESGDLWTRNYMTITAAGKDGNTGAHNHYSFFLNKFEYTDTDEVLFDANGGYGKMAPQIYRGGAPGDLQRNSFMRDDYTFNGWNTKADGTGERYADGQYLSNPKSMTLYAQWKASQYTVTWDANGGKGSMSGQNFADGVAQKLMENAFTRTGYTFSGWNTKADGSGTQYSDQQYVTNPGNIKLYAQWKADQYTVTWDANGGKIGTGGTATTNYTTGTKLGSVPIPGTPTRTGYGFVEWKAVGSTYPVSFIDTTEHNVTATGTEWTCDFVNNHPYGNIKMQAQWKANQYTVTWDANGGTIGTEATKTTKYTTGTTLGSIPIPGAPTRAGYQFVEWKAVGSAYPVSFTDANNHNVEATATEWTGEYANNHPYGDIKMQAQWKLLDHVAQTSTDGGKTWTKYASLQEAVNAATGTNNTVELLGNIEMSEMVTSTTSYILDGKGYTMSRAKSGFNNLLKVTDGTVVVKNVTMDGNRDSGITAKAALIAAWGENANLTLGEGVTLQNNYNDPLVSKYSSDLHGGGAQIGYGTLTVQDGATIKNNVAAYGGGIHVNMGAELIMNGGAIQRNQSDNGGGVGTYYKAASDMNEITLAGTTIVTDNTKLDGATVHNMNLQYGNLTVQQGFAGKVGISDLSGKKTVEGAKFADVAGYQSAAGGTFTNDVNGDLVVLQKADGLYWSPKQSGGDSTVEVSGTAVSWNNSNDAVYLLYKADTSDTDIRAEWLNDTYTNSDKVVSVGTGGAISAVTVENKAMQEQSFSFSGVDAGEYKLVIFKPGKYVPKIVTVTVGDTNESLVQYKLWLYGDVNYDGKVNNTDVTNIDRYVRGFSSILASGTDSEQVDRRIAANVSAAILGDQLIDALDATHVQSYFRQQPSVFDFFK